MDFALLFIAGLFAGFVNASSGAGSILTLPALIFTGLDPSSANATNRISVLLQSIVTAATFRRGGVTLDAPLRWLLVPICVGTPLGVWLAAGMAESTFRVFTALVFVALCPLLLVRLDRNPTNRNSAHGNPSTRKPVPVWMSHLLLFCVGVYAGFIQAATGILILLLVHRFLGVDLMRANGLKVLMVLVLTAIALPVFWFSSVPIDLFRGLWLAIATMIGGYYGAAATLHLGQKWVRITLIGMLILSSAKLLYDATKVGW